MIVSEIMNHDPWAKWLRENKDQARDSCSLAVEEKKGGEGEKRWSDLRK